MIIFYNNKTGAILGRIDGRVHSDSVTNGVKMHYSNIPDEDIGKYVVPFVDNMVEEEEEIKELLVEEGTNKVKEFVTGTRKVLKPHGKVPDVSFADLIYQIEKREVRIFDYKVVTDKNGLVTDIVKK